MAEDPITALLAETAALARAGDAASLAQAESLLRDAFGRVEGEAAAAVEGQLRFVQIRGAQAALSDRL